MPSPVSAEQVVTGGDQFGERGDKMCSAAANCEAASLARAILSPSALVTAIMSASSTTPFFSAGDGDFGLADDDCLDQHDVVTGGFA